MKTSIIGQQLVELDLAESTNKTAAEMLGLSKLLHGAVILAHEQSAGRGQRGRVWHSGPGLDLTFSVVVRPRDLRAEQQFVLSKLAALAVYALVSSVVPNGVRIKWPNDILIGRQKVAGILIQNELAGDRVLWSIIGIGLNVNSRAFEADLEATSLALAVGGDLDRFSLLETFCQYFERLWSEWDGGGRAWEERYTELLWSRGRWAAVVMDGNPLMVRPMDVDRQGRLIVELEDGSVASYGLDRLRFASR